MGGSQLRRRLPEAFLVLGVIAATVGLALLNWTRAYVDTFSYSSQPTPRHPFTVPVVLRQLYMYRDTLYGDGYGINGWVAAYCGWLCWVLLAVTAGAGLAAVGRRGRTRRATLAGIVAAVVAVLGAGLTIAAAIGVVRAPRAAPSDAQPPFLKHEFTSLLAGPWVTAAGLLLCGVAALIAARRTTDSVERVRPARGSVRTRAGVALIMTVGAIVCCYLAVYHVGWYRQYFDHDALTTYHFTDFGDSLDGPPTPSSVPGHVGILGLAYFPVLASVLAIGGVMSALAALVWTSVSAVLRTLGVLAGVGGVVVTLILMTGDGIREITELPGYHPQPGVFLMIIGFALAAIACLVAPPGGVFTSRRRVPPPAPTGVADDVPDGHTAAVG